MSQPQLWYANGVDQAVFTRPGSGSPVLLAHATSFHARCWNQVIAHLPGVPVVAYDLRGHGLSTKVEPPADWFAFGRDLIALVDRLDLRDVVAVGHSMGGHSVVMAAAQRPDRFAALLLIDPVIWPRAIYHQQHFTSHPSRRR
ncbi:MAG TPA: alpha/beta fold hydrolase, partial [Aggregatilineales bacterium]|nr:alpha/beta fold hydrolase [Aggregatilineales bacterium]